MGTRKKIKKIGRMARRCNFVGLMRVVGTILLLEIFSCVVLTIKVAALADMKWLPAIAICFAVPLQLWNGIYLFRIIARTENSVRSSLWAWKNMNAPLWLGLTNVTLLFVCVAVFLLHGCSTLMTKVADNKGVVVFGTVLFPLCLITAGFVFGQHQRIAYADAAFESALGKYDRVRTTDLEIDIGDDFDTFIADELRIHDGDGV